MTISRWRRPSRLIVLALLLVGCLPVTHTESSGLGYPAGPTLAQFGLDERCIGEDGSCTDRAIDLAAEILSSLGEPYTGPSGLEDGDASRFVIDAQHDPAFEWRAANGRGGTTQNVAVDLTPLVLGEASPPFAIIGGAGDPQAPMFVVPDELGRELLEALFVGP